MRRQGNLSTLEARGLGDYWFTTLSAVRRRDPDWAVIAAYEAPIRRFLGERYGRISGGDRDDIAQEVLVAMRERIVAGYDPSRGPFRPFLRTAIANRVRDFCRRKRGAGLDPEGPAVEMDEPEVELADADAIDLEATVTRAIRAFHDRHAHGKGRDRRAVYVLSGALVHGLSNEEIAKREGLSRDQVKRTLQGARDEILSGLFGDHLGLEGGSQTVRRAADLARSALREPRREARLMEDEPDARVRDSVAGFLGRLRSAAARGADPDFLRGVQAIFA